MILYLRFSVIAPRQHLLFSLAWHKGNGLHRRLGSGDDSSQHMLEALLQLGDRRSFIEVGAVIEVDVELLTKGIGLYRQIVARCAWVDFKRQDRKVRKLQLLKRKILQSEHRLEKRRIFKTAV